MDDCPKDRTTEIMNYTAAKTFILKKLERELNPELTYHSISHTLDVLQSAERLALMENVSAEDLVLLQTACLFHDSGMLVTYRGHEEASVIIVRENLPGFGYTPHDIDRIANMIMDTKLPQCAVDPLEKILCDADLDYLGRQDFFMIAHRLKYEWAVMNINRTTLQDWYLIQREFLSAHKYFTRSAIHLRQEGKMENLHQIEIILNHEK
jgi:predicted metal-dependent HD superfamily phosphohydrolase